MKTKLTGIGFLLLFITAITLTAFNQNDSGKGKKEQHQDKGKGQEKGNKGNGYENKGNGKPDWVEQKQNKKNDAPGQGNNKDFKDNSSKGNIGNNGNGNNKNDNDYLDDDNKGNSNVKTKKGKHVKGDVYIWDRETFKDRKNLRDGEKITICHKFDNNNEPAVTIKVSVNAKQAHMAHGDAVGECPATSTNRYSSTFLERRNDYYSTIYETEDQVTYSRSILDYALERLAISRLQLADMQRRNLPAQQIESKQARVVDLEENVSLLQTLLGVATNLLVDRL